ncbi:PID-CTERM protein-sorting domain-containing protein [Flavicella sediminum]|uniref:PID-CTERM protein-sorting domain-containing protein n=1 Tax=Flavicella sediminum TaxID=2585141 RepID=UPI00111F8017|nr:hypothetical protein [Flavicella sediminum]
MKTLKTNYPMLVLVLVFIGMNTTFAQGPPPPPPPPGLPIDGGIIGLLLLAIGYASKKIYSK